MSVPTEQETYSKPTEAELVKAREIIAEAKKKAKLNRAKSPQQAWARFDEVRNKIRDYVNNNELMLRRLAIS